jgi:hypothetical protein
VTRKIHDQVSKPVDKDKPPTAVHHLNQNVPAADGDWNGSDQSGRKDKPVTDLVVTVIQGANKWPYLLAGDHQNSTSSPAPVCPGPFVSSDRFRLQEEFRPKEDWRVCLFHSRP